MCQMSKVKDLVSIAMFMNDWMETARKFALNVNINTIQTDLLFSELYSCLIIILFEILFYLRCTAVKLHKWNENVLQFVKQEHGA